MTPETSLPVTPNPAATRLLAQLGDRLDGSPVPVDAAQYRAVMSRLAEALAALPPGPALSALLEAHPAAAELYENLNYQHAGLCRSPLDAALAAETRAAELIQRAKRRSEESKNR